MQQKVYGFFVSRQLICQPILQQTCLLIMYKVFITSHLDNSDAVFDQTANASFPKKIEVSSI